MTAPPSLRARCILAVATWASLAVLAGSLPIRAEEIPAHERARDLVRRGKQLYDDGDYRGALQRFEAAQTLYPSYKIEFNVGATHEALGQTASAVEHWERFLREAEKHEADRAVVGELRAKLATLRPRVAIVTVSCSVRDAEVVADGTIVGKTPLPEPIYLEPGSHRLVLNRTGYPLIARTLTVAAGDRREVIIQSWSREASPVLVQGAVHPRPRPEPATPSRPVYKRWWFWTIVGAAVVGITTGCAVGLTQGSDRLPNGRLGVLVLGPR